MKKAGYRFLMICLLISAVTLIYPATTVKAANTSGSFENRITQLKKKFPAGKYWNHAQGKKNNPDKYTSKPCTHHGNCSKNGVDFSGSCGCNSFNGSSIQCMGFAEKLGYDVFGTNPRTQWKKIYNLGKLKAGDILRYGTHSVFVTKVSGDTITYADCNSDGHCIIRWDATMKKSSVRNLVYIQRANNYNAVMKGSQNTPSDIVLNGVTPVGGNRLKVEWKRDSKVTGYEILISKDPNFKSGNRKITVKKNQVTSKILRVQSLNRNYYVKIRAYKVVDGKRCRGNYSAVLSGICQ